LKQIRRHLTYANVMSSIAVFLMLGGATAFAATKIGANEIKANSIKTGKIVKEAVTAGKIKNGAVTESKIADGAVTTNKIADNAVTTGKIVNDAVTGDKVKESSLAQVPSALNSVNSVNSVNANVAGSPATLASGKTETGVFYNIETIGTGNTGFIGTVISFPFPLASAPTRNYRPIGSLPNAACPGTAGNPQAAPGNLCAYETVNGTGNVAFFDNSVEEGLRRFGDGIAVFQSGGTGNVDLIGSWAVTAP
jgi:prepilin-type processing-associated H-X9-DG protein